MVEKFTVERQTGQVKTIESDLTFLKSSKEINEHKKSFVGDSQIILSRYQFEGQNYQNRSEESNKSIL